MNANTQFLTIQNDIGIIKAHQGTALADAGAQALVFCYPSPLSQRMSSFLLRVVFVRSHICLHGHLLLAQPQIQLTQSSMPRASSWATMATILKLTASPSAVSTRRGWGEC